MKIIKIITILLFNYSILSGSFKAYQTTGNRAIAMCGAFTAVADDITAILYNPAGLSLLKNSQIYGEYANLFNVNDLYQFAFLFGSKSKIGAFGLGLINLSFKNIYKENLWILSYANNLKEMFNFGLNLKLYDRKIEGEFGPLPEYSLSEKIGVDIAILFSVSSFLSIGATTFNVNKPAIIKEEGAAVTRLGLKLSPFILFSNYIEAEIRKSDLENFIVSIDVFKNRYKNKTTLTSGLEYRINEFFSIRGGTDWTEKLTFGAGFIFSNIEIDYSFISNSEMLNNNHTFSVKFQF